MLRPRTLDAWFGWPWNDTRNAAALACELVRRVIPPPLLVKKPAEPADQQLYRPLYVEADAVNVEPVEAVEARSALTTLLDAVDAYVLGGQPKIPEDFGEPDQAESTRLYWWTDAIRHRALSACRAYAEQIVPVLTGGTSPSLASAVSPRDRGGLRKEKLRVRVGDDTLIINGPPVEQQFVRTLAWCAIRYCINPLAEFLLKLACGTSVTVTGARDGTGNAMLRRIAETLLWDLIITYEDVQERVLHWRIYDGLKGRQLSPAIREDLILAFEAAWAAGQFAYGYSLLEGIEVLATQENG